ncbi:hypothetical protein KQH60_12455 [Mycetohabitans sp. B8]|nr:hypothetical protein [Mycetohabitans sp. B8]
MRAVAGAIVTLDHEGKAVIHREPLQEAKALRTREELRQRFTASEDANEDKGDEADEVAKTAKVSNRLAQRLSAHRTAALRIEVAQHLQVALATLVHGMVLTVLPGSLRRLLAVPDSHKVWKSHFYIGANNWALSASIVQRNFPLGPRQVG